MDSFLKSSNESNFFEKFFQLCVSTKKKNMVIVYDGTITTGHGAIDSTAELTLPRSLLEFPTPFDPITMQRIDASFASLMISIAA